MVVKETISTDPLGNDMYDEVDSSHKDGFEVQNYLHCRWYERGQV